MSQALYRKYRPRGWADVIGQLHVVQTLRNAIAADRVGHAYLFAGPRGTGKTTLARILAKAVNCLAEDRAQRPCNECANCKAVNENRFLDLIEMDAASNTGVEDVRGLRDKINFTPSQGKFRIYIIDEVHMLSTQAFNALLKTLEEPPPHAIFILATTEIHKIPATVISRCQRHEFRRVPVDEILTSLRGIAAQEGLKADEAALSVIARQATGSIRDAQSLLDQLASTETSITLELTQTVLGTATNQAVLDIVESIVDQLAGSGLENVHRALDAGADPRTLARQIVEYLRDVMLIQMGNGGQVEAIQDIRRRMTMHSKAFQTSEILRLIRAFNEAATDTRGGWQPSLALELALAAAYEQPQPAPFGGDSGGAKGGQLEPKDGHGRQRPSPAASAGHTEPLPGKSGLARPAAGPRALPLQTAELEPAAAPVREPAETYETRGDAAGGTRRTVSLTELGKAWKGIRAAIKPEHPAVEALLNSCKPVEVRGDELLLGFQSETVCSLMDKPENLEVARAAIAEVLGVSLRIKCGVINAKGKLPPTVSQDGMVATALNHGGEIVDVQE